MNVTKATVLNREPLRKYTACGFARLVARCQYSAQRLLRSISAGSYSAGFVGVGHFGKCQ